MAQKQQFSSNNYQYSSDEEEDEDPYQYNHRNQYQNQHQQDGGQDEEDDQDNEDQEYENQEDGDYDQEQDQQDEDEEEGGDEGEGQYNAYYQKQNYRGDENAEEEEDEQQESYTNNLEYKQQRDYFSNQHQINEQSDEEEDHQNQDQQDDLDSEEEQIKQYQEFLKQQQIKQQMNFTNQNQGASLKNTQQKKQQISLDQDKQSNLNQQSSKMQKNAQAQIEQSSSGKKQNVKKAQMNNFLDKENIKNQSNQQNRNYQYSDDEDDQEEDDSAQQLSNKFQKNSLQQTQQNPNAFSFGANKRPVSAVVKQADKNQQQNLSDPQNNYQFNQLSYEEQIADLKKKMQQNIDFQPTQKRLQIQQNSHQLNNDDFNNFVQEDDAENSSENSFDQYNSQNHGKENYLAPKMKHLQHVPRPKSSYIVSNNNQSNQSSQIQPNVQKGPYPYLKKGTSTASLAVSRVKTASTANLNNSKYNSRTQQESTEQEYDRPSTAATYKPVYKMSMNEFKIKNKQFDYTNKKFKTIPKKSDPVSRFQSMQQAWKSNKFLKSNNNTSSSKAATSEREGRKLNLQERISSSKPQNMFYRYMTKNDIINQYV
ncbi:hypothetical protein ABPG74_009180 [Tetrahymena malaccensis]